MLALLALFGPKQGLRIPLEGQLVLGRGPDADLQLADPRVSRAHCRVEASGHRVTIEDLGSRSGTFVNGERIGRRTPLGEGDEVTLGDSLLLVAGADLVISNARYGTGTLVVTRQGRAATAFNPGPPLAAVAGPEGMRGLDALAGRLAAAADEEEGVKALLDAVETELAPRRSMILLRLWHGEAGEGRERVVPLAIRSKDAVSSTSRTLLERAAVAQRGILVEDAFDSREARGARSVVLHSLRSVMVVPWGQREAPPRGFLHVDRDSDRPFGAADLAWIEAAGHLATLRLGDRPRANAAKSDEGPVGGSPAFVRVLELATVAAHADRTVLLLGEPGTGKDELAQLIHARSARHRGPFVAVHCGALAEDSDGRELLGREKGASPGGARTALGAFEAADGGTLFLDEIGDMPLPVQATLLRVLRERAVVRAGTTTARQVDVRVVAATHRDLEADVKERLFCGGLFARLNDLAITVPPLRARREDLPLLARVLLERIARRLGLRSPGLHPEGEEALATWDYPGNLRELGAVLERVLLLRDPRDPTPVDRDEVMAALCSSIRPVSPALPASEERLVDALARVEKANIEAAMRRAHGVKSHAARILGISRPILDKKLAELRIDIWAPA